METKIPGVYPGSLNTETVNKMDEIDLFLTILDTEEDLLKLREKKLKGLISSEVLAEKEYELEYLRYQTIRFGVEIQGSSENCRLFLDDSYFAWYGFYNNYFKYVLTKEEFQKFKEAKLEGKDTSMFMPSGSWTDLLKNNSNERSKVSIKH